MQQKTLQNILRMTNHSPTTPSSKCVPHQHLPGCSKNSQTRHFDSDAENDPLFFYPIPEKLTSSQSQTGARKSENLPCLQIAIIMRDPSFVSQAAKPSWLTATEGSFGSASWIKAETFVSASTTLVQFQARWTAQLERRDVYQDYQNNWSGKRNWRKPTHKGATTASTLHSQ